MVECVGCAMEMGFADRMNANSYNGLCRSCANHGRKVAAGLDDETIEAVGQAARQYDLKVDAILLTTETAPNLNITERIEIVTAECAFGMNIFKDLFAGVRDIVGGRSEAVQQTMRDSRKTALYELKKEAYEVGANAVVGVDLDYVELSKAGSMVMLVASGTAVRIEG
ncbi:hypothetical protein TR2A62_0537 [Thalassobium sp. R2A62]|nr:hypothetical protein TR2A62_0537 [Thalassobium sp. R2A62]